MILMCTLYTKRRISKVNWLKLIEELDLEITLPSMKTETQKDKLLLKQKPSLFGTKCKIYFNVYY
jgi:hypothetical protein